MCHAGAVTLERVKATVTRERVGCSRWFDLLQLLAVSSLGDDALVSHPPSDGNSGLDPERFARRTELPPLNDFDIRARSAVVTQIFASWNQTVGWLRCVNSLRHVGGAVQTESGGHGANGRRWGSDRRLRRRVRIGHICESRCFCRVSLSRRPCCATHSRSHSCPSGTIRRPTRCDG